MSFINPLYLIAAAGALIPVIIHLTRKRRAKKIQFSSLIFLKASPKELIRKRRLRDLILLIIRSVILALLALVFARPFFPKEKFQIYTGEEDKSIVLLIDNSYSMSYGFLFEKLRDESQKIINDAGSRDEISIVLFSDMAKQLTPFTPDKRDLKNTLDTKLKKSFRTTDYYKSLQLAEEILKDAQNPQRIIVMISDFQDYAFGSQFQSWKLNPEITFVPVTITPEKSDNTLINNFNLKQSKTDKIKAAEFRAELVRNEKSKAQEVNCELYIDNLRIHSQKLNPEHTNQAFFQQFDLKNGKHTGFIKIENDNLEPDNTLFFTFEAADLPQILCIDGRSGDKHNDRFFLQSAFDIGDESIFKFSSKNRTYISKSNLKQYDLLFLTEINTLTADQTGVLQEYVSEGGNIVFSFGDNIYTNFASSLLKNLGIGSITNADEIKISAVKNSIITDVNFRHPVFSLFIESGAAEIFRPKFKRYIEILPDSSTIVLGSYDSGFPFLIEKKLEKGRIFLYTSTFGTSWTDFPVHDIYIPFLYQLANYAATSEKNQNSFLVGETVPIKGNPGEKWEIKSPGNRRFDLTADEQGIVRFGETDIPGNYEAISEKERLYFSVNINILESDLKYRNPEEVSAVVSKPGEGSDRSFTGSKEEEKTDEEKRQKVWKYILSGLILAFVFETFYANKSYKKDKDS